MSDIYTSQGVQRIAAERARQTTEEGWTPGHDRTQHAPGELAGAACALLLLSAGLILRHSLFPNIPPKWLDLDKMGHKPPARLLEIAGALIAAELDRSHSGGDMEGKGA